MKAVYIATGFVALGLSAWVVVIIINAARTRMKIINERKRRSIK